MNTFKSLQFELIPSAAPAQIVSHHQFRLAGQWIDYTLKRSRRRRGITLTVDENGLRVGAAWRVLQRRIESVLDAHSPWITRKLAECQARKPAPFSWAAGAIIMVMGEPLKLAPAPERTFTLPEGDCLHIAANPEDPAMLAKHVIAWLRGTALEWFAQRAAHYAPVLAVHTPVIRLSNARTRWGSCHPGGHVRLNWRLIQMPPALIDYVVVHELAHLREPNHSQRFWRWVAEVLPDHKLRRRALRLEAHRYLLA